MMIIRLILFLIYYAAVLAVPGGLVWHFGLRPYWKKYQKKFKARKHAKELMEHDEQLCFECRKECNENDCYEAGKGWYHARCMRALMNEVDDKENGK